MQKTLIYGSKITVLLIMFNINLLFAQPPNDGFEPGVPIDGGASLLAAAGVAYGVKKYRDFRKKEGQENENDL